MVYSIVQIKTPSNGVQLWWSLWGLVRADQRERRRHQYTGTMQNAPIYQYILYRHHAQGTNIQLQDEILKTRLEPETKIVGIFWCKFFRADSNFANLKRILGLFSLIWGIFTQHYFFGAKFPRQKVLIFMFCMFRPWTIVIYTQSAPFFYLHTECMFFCFIWNLGWPILKK